MELGLRINHSQYPIYLEEPEYVKELLGTVLHAIGNFENEQNSMVELAYQLIMCKLLTAPVEGLSNSLFHLFAIFRGQG